MNQEQIKMLIDAFAASDLSTLEFSEDGCTLRLARQGAAPGSPPTSPPSPPSSFPATTEAAAAIEAVDIAAPPPPTPPAPTPADDVLAPLYGVVHLRPAPGEPDFVQAGQTVEAGQTLCVIEAMKVFNEVHATRRATIGSIRVESGQEVDAGQILFRLG